MKEIDGVNLNDLVEEVSKGIIDERRKQAAGVIKQQLQRIEQLVIDSKNLEKQLKKKNEKLAKAQEKLDKIKSGDWKVLSELENQKEEKEEKEDDSKE